MKKPDALVIGAQKCATTWLYQCLHEHPRMFVPDDKRDATPLGRPPYAGQNSEAYFEPFTNADSSQLIVDVSTDYLYEPACAPAVYHWMPGCRLIAMLRDPVDRAVSGYNWLVRRGALPSTPIEEGLSRIARNYRREPGALDEAEAEVIERGFYAEQIARYLRFFPLSRFLFILYEAVKEHPAETIAETYRFLGVETTHVPVALKRRPKVSPRFKTLLSLENHLSRVRWLAEGIGRRIIGKSFDLLSRCLAHLSYGKKRSRKLSESLRSELLDLYRPRVEDLASLLSGARIVANQDAGSPFDRWL